MNSTIILDEYQNPVTIHSKNDFNKMRKAGKLASMVLRLYYAFCKRRSDYFRTRYTLS